MISVEIEEKEDVHILINGHAEKEEAVCHAVSGLFYALLEFLKESGSLIKKISIKEGRSELIFSGDNKNGFRMFYLGIKKIAESYGEDLEIVKS